jgi:hypothetical protein
LKSKNLSNDEFKQILKDKWDNMSEAEKEKLKIAVAKDTEEWKNKVLEYERVHGKKPKKDKKKGSDDDSDKPAKSLGKKKDKDAKGDKKGVSKDAKAKDQDKGKSLNKGKEEESKKANKKK